MLEDLSLTLPRFRAYEQTIPMNDALETSLFAVYTEVIFSTHARYTFSELGRMVCGKCSLSHSTLLTQVVLLLRNAWPELRGDCTRTIQRIKRLSATAEREVGLTRMRLDTQKYQQVLDLMASLQTKDTKPKSKTSHYLPFTETARFCGREDILSEIDQALDSNTGAQLKTFAVYGMGGVGKTQVALRYASYSRTKYDAVLWVSADNPMTIAQSFRAVAKSLGLVEPDVEIDDNEIMMAVKK